ncbi:MAG: acetoin utilization protein AcuC [Armatimonadaceae bacterium]
MRHRACLFHSDRYIDYDFGSSHPMQQRRLLDIMARISAVPGIGETLEFREPQMPTDAELCRVHSPQYVNMVHRVSEGDAAEADRWGLGAGDTPGFRGVHPASARICGGTLAAAHCLVAEDCRIAINLAGGLHHAFADRASGFCVYNDIALGIRTLQDNGLGRVAYVDIDVHHGDGVEALFREDPDVLTVSIHESGEWLFPGTGRAADRGSGDARDSVVNVPVAPGTNDTLWWESFEAVVPKVLADFAPDAIVLQIGADAHFADPLAHVRLSSHGWLRAVDWLLEFGADTPVLVTGGGGYDRDAVVRLRCAGMAVPQSWHDSSRPSALSNDEAERIRAYNRRQVLEALRGR